MTNLKSNPIQPRAPAPPLCALFLSRSIVRSFVRSFVRSTTTRRRSRSFVGVRSSSSSDEPNRFVFTVVVDDVFVARPAGGCVCRRRRRRRSGRTHWDGDVCMCKQYCLSHSGTHTHWDTLGRTHWDGCMCLYVCVNSTVCPTVGHVRAGHTGTCLYVCVNSMVLWFGSVQPSIHPSIHPRPTTTGPGGRRRTRCDTIIGNDDDRFGDRARRRRRRRARSRVDSSNAHRFVSRRATAKKSNGRGVVKVVAPSGATGRGHRDDASATDER